MILCNHMFGESHARIARFIVAGAGGAGTQLGLLYILTDILGLWYLASAVLAFVVAQGVSFTLQKWWTFRDLSRDRLAGKMAQYFMVGVSNLVANTALLFLFVEYAHLHYLAAQACTSIGIAFVSYQIYKRYIFLEAEVV